MRVLCADDDADIRVILDLALRLAPDIEPTIVDSGLRVMEEVPRGPWDAILLDAMMPGMDGYATCEALKADPATRDIPVIFLTARTERGESARAIALGALACLAKPFDPMTLASEFRAALDRGAV
jgi:CheY-like chemotaxis protein